jgi:hypothetical protein
MMEDSRIGRRAFLKKFVILSMLSVAEGCLPEPQPIYGALEIVTVVPEYGVEPIDMSPQVSQMTYLGESGGENTLYGGTDIPINTQFIIYFVHSMDPSSQDAAVLSDADGNAVGFESSWLDNATLKIIPDATLQYATQYALEIGEEAKNVRGEPLQLTGSGRAEFTTVE